MREFLKKLFVGVMMAVSLLSSTLVMIAPAGAEDYGLEAARSKGGIPKTVIGESSIPGIAGKVIAVGMSLLGILFFAMMLYAGLVWMKARGNTEEVEKAKTIIESAIIGLVLITAAYAITTFVFTSLQAAS